MSGLSANTTYHYRADDRFGLPPEAVVILADDDPDWRPNAYAVRLEITKLTFEFEPIKILDWAGRKPDCCSVAERLWPQRAGTPWPVRCGSTSCRWRRWRRHSGYTEIPSARGVRFRP